jgi:penicillin-binding protein-related factor A (putative recombinase)
MSGIRGRALEHAIGAAAVHYKRVDRAEIHKQVTPQTQYVGYSGKAPIDFRGWCRDSAVIGGQMRPCVLEAKECNGASLPFGEHLAQHQVEALLDNHARGILTWLIVDMTLEREVYRVGGAELAAFVAAPWRSSLSLAWLRAFGELCKESDRDNPRKRAVWWLDVGRHPLQAASYLAVAAEKARAEGKVVELYPVRGINKGAAAVTLRELLACKSGRDATDLERLRWQDRFTAWQLEKNISEAKRVAARTKKRGWGQR